jgi:hypothetical protein
MTQDDASLAAHASAIAAQLDLPLAPAHLPGVLASLKVAAGAAAFIARVPLTPADEPDR